MSNLDDLTAEIQMLRAIIATQMDAGALDKVSRNIERLAKVMGINRRMTGGGRQLDDLLGSLLEEVGVQLGIPDR